MPRTNLLRIVLLFSALIPSSVSFAEERPNILLILADDVGQEVLGCYGGESYPTPRLDKLASEGMLFQHGYAMPACHPTRIALMTGQYPFRLDHPKWGSFPQDQENETIGQIAKKAGYKTAISGKWQLALQGKDRQSPARCGFDQSALFGWHEGSRYYEPYIWKNGELWEGIEEKYGPELYTQFLINFMTENRDQPFFAYYSMALCHDVTDDLKEPVPYAPGKDRFDSYSEMAIEMDHQVGRLLDALDQLKLREETLVIFTGDNGTPMKELTHHENGKYIRKPLFSKINGEMLQGGKTSLYDTGTRVPLLVRWPAVIKPGQTTNALVDMVDYLPTVADAMGQPVPSSWQLEGSSFIPVLKREVDTARDWVFAQGRTFDASSAKKNTAWVRTARWKLYYDGRLFDMQNDVREQAAISPGQGSDEAKTARKQLQAVFENEIVR
jgi:arylsulfatase A